MGERRSPCSLHSARGHGHTVRNAIAWVKDYLLTGRKPGENLRNPIRALPDLHQGALRASISDDEHGPTVSTSEEGSNGYGERILGTPAGDIDNHPELVPEPWPGFRRIDQVDDGAYALFLDPEGGDLGETP